MTGIRKSAKSGPIVEINMIPMIDIMLVLLVIFMVMTPMLVQQQIKINLPKSVSATDAADRPMTVTVRETGDLSLNGKPVTAGVLGSELKSLMLKDNDRPLVIQADRNVPLQKVVAVMDIAKQSQVQRLGISVEQPK